MKIISFSETFANVQSFALAYNQQYIYLDAKGKKKTHHTFCLRSSHLALFQEIIRCYAAQLHKTPPLSHHSFPPFSTNNQILANRLHISSRTVQRYLLRLQQSGLVLHKIFKGSHSSFDLYLNTDVLYTYPQAYIQTDSSVLPIPKNTSDYQSFTLHTTTNCPHKDTSSFTNSGINAVEGGKLETPISSPPATQTQPGNTGTGNTGQEMGSGQPVAVKNSAAPARLAQLDDWVDRLFTFMQHTLFHRFSYLSFSQIHKSKQFLRSYFDGYTPQNYQQCYHHLQNRVILAQNYINRQPGRFIPLPALYLNPDNPHGFSKTKLWYDKALLSSARASSIQNAHQDHMCLWNVFLNSIKNYQQNPSIHHYQLTRNKLSTLHPPLTVAFDSFIQHSFSI